MIRNIVFDMGMVLMDFHPLETCRAIAPDEEGAQQLYAAFFAHPEWTGLDDGSMDEWELCRRATARLEEERLRPLLARIVEAMPGNVLSPAPGMEALVDWVLEAGFRVYLLSNAGFIFSRHREMIPHIGRFHGVMFSAEEGLVKPDGAIYRRLTDRYGLVPEECLFIDDNVQNILAARREGWHAYAHNGNAAALRLGLEDLARKLIPAQSDC